MVTTHQQFVFEDASFSELPGLIFSSRYTTLALAAADASAVHGILVIDTNWPSTTTSTLACDVMAGGGVISCTGGQTLTISGRVIGDSQIFDIVSGASPWNGDPSMTGIMSARTPASPFPVNFSTCTDVNAAWFGVCVTAAGSATRIALQAAFCSVSAGTAGPYGATVRIPGGTTYVFDRNTVNDGTTPLPFGVLLPEQRDLKVIADGAVFDYNGSEFLSSGRGTCAFGYYSDQLAADYWRSGFEWCGGLVLPSAPGTNSDFLWMNGSNCRMTVRNLQVGDSSAGMGGAFGHRHAIVQCQWNSSQVFTGQRILLDNCDITQCTDTGVVIVQCDGAEVSACRMRTNVGSGIELGCAGLRSYNLVAQNGHVSGAKILAGNYEVNKKSGVKCIDARNTWVSSDFEANAKGNTNSDANVDFTGLFEYMPTGRTASTIAGSPIITPSFDPVMAGWRIGMVVKDKQGKLGLVNQIVTLSATSIQLSSAVSTNNASLNIAAFLGTGDREGRAQNCTWNNSDPTTGMQAWNVITQSSTILDQDLHDGTTTNEWGVLHLSSSQPLWCTKEVFSSTSTVKFSPDSWFGGVITRESAVACMLPPNTSIAGFGLYQLTPSFTLDHQSIMVEAAGLADATTGSSAHCFIRVMDVTNPLSPVLKQTLTAGSAPWEEGHYQSQESGARLAHITQLSYPPWMPGTPYAIFAVNTIVTGSTFNGGVVFRYCPLIPS